MELITIQVLTLGNVYHRAVVIAVAACCTATQSALQLLEDAVGDGTDGTHGLNDDVLRHTDIQVGIGSHHVRVAAGSDVFIHVHRVGEGTMALSVKGIIELEDLRDICAVHDTGSCTNTLRSRDDTSKAIQHRTIDQGELQATLQSAVDRISVLQLRALGQRSSTATAWRVAEHVNQQGLTRHQYVLETARSKHVQGISLQWFGLVGRTVLRQCQRHGLQGIGASHQTYCLVGSDVEVAATHAVKFYNLRRRIVLHAVVYGHLATANRYDIYDTCACVIIISIALGHLHLNGIAAVQTEHRIAEGVVSGMTDAVIARQGNLDLIASYAR